MCIYNIILEVFTSLNSSKINRYSNYSFDKANQLRGHVVQESFWLKNSPID